jgi:hypothetical protein
MTSRTRVLALMTASALAGVVIGGWLFARTQPRSILAIRPCTDCLSPSDLAGLLASAGIQRTPGLIPFVALETDKTIAVKLPLSGGHVHYVIFPKQDMKDIADISPDDEAYLMDALFVARRLIERDGLKRYRLYTNGPRLQSVGYLHFHLEQDPLWH